MTKEISLNQGKVALVDDSDFEWLNQWKWRAVLKNRSWYAFRTEGGRKQSVTIYMHIEILKPSKGKKVDHRDGDGLNNQRHNLRECTHAQNMQNQKLSVASSTGFKGVTWDRQKNKFRASIHRNGKTNFLGLFSTSIEGAYAYDITAIQFFGDFAKLNFPQSHSPFLKVVLKRKALRPG